MKTPKDIVNELGRDNVMATLGVPTSAITNAFTAGHFPTSWYLPLKNMAKKKRVSIPDELFKWRGAV